MKFFLITLSFLLTSGLYSQNLKGKVVDENGKPLEAVDIFNKRTGKHTHSDATGGFTLLKVSVDDSVYFSSLGFKTKFIGISLENVDLGIAHF